MKKVARLRVAQDEQFVPPGVKINPEQAVRTTGRIKKPKAVFDPSDNYMPRSHRMSTQFALQATSPPAKLVSSEPTSPSTTAARRERCLSTGSNTSNTSISQNNDICIVCLKRDPRRGGNYRNKLISCIECNKRVHKMCMNVDFFETAQVRANFKCDSCRTCEICSGNAQLDGITCAKCCKSYHLGCHTPKLSKIYQTERHWKCYKCSPSNSTSGDPNKHGNSVNNVNIMPVKIIRQIIGDNVNLANSQQKNLHTHPAPQDPLQLPQQPVKLQQLQQKSHLKQSSQSQKSVQLQERVNIKEAAAEASNIRRKRTTSAPTSTSNSEDDDSFDDSNDEDFEYIEQKKKPRIKSEHNNNHDIANASDLKPERKKVVSTSVNSVIDLPKREIVKSWSVKQVATYISKYFPNESGIFIDQEIDGNALLLLKRSDVVQKLPLKLGPSLRLYNLILKIQTQNANDPTIGWDCSVDTLLPSTE